MFARTAELRFGALGRMGIVAAIHVAGIFVIGRSLGIIPAIEVEPPRVIIENVDRPPPPDDPPPPSQYQANQVIDYTLPIPEPPTYEREDQPPSGPQGTIGDPPRLDGTGDNIPRPAIQGARLDARHPLSQPLYPPDLRRQGVEGAVDVEIFVQPDGRIGDARVVRSSGYPGFDRVTLDEARRKWRMAPATRDGVPFAQWYRLRVVFKLEDQR